MPAVLLPDLHGFELPDLPTYDWDSFQGSHATDCLLRFAAPWAERTFVRFRFRTGNWDLVLLALLCSVPQLKMTYRVLVALHITVVAATVVILSLKCGPIAWLARRTAQRRYDAWISGLPPPAEFFFGLFTNSASGSEVETTRAPTRRHGDLSSSPEASPGPESLSDVEKRSVFDSFVATAAAEHRAALQELAGTVTAIVSTLAATFSHMTLTEVCRSFTMPEGYPGTADDLCYKRIPWGTSLSVLFLTRQRFALHAALFSFHVVGYPLFAATTGYWASARAIFGNAAVIAALTGGTVFAVTAAERQDRQLFLTVVKASCARRAVARHLAAVATTAAAVAPPYAAAQLRTLSGLDGRVSLPPFDATAASVGVAAVYDFPHWATGVLPARVVLVLHELFTAYDTAAVRFGVERLGTFGDVYAVAAGVDGDGVARAETVSDAARRVSSFVLWQVRAGAPSVPIPDSALPLRPVGAVCTGPLAAGVVGSSSSLRFAAAGPALWCLRLLLEAAPPGCVFIDEATAGCRASTTSALSEEGFTAVRCVSTSSLHTHRPSCSTLPCSVERLPQDYMFGALEPLLWQWRSVTPPDSSDSSTTTTEGPDPPGIGTQESVEAVLTQFGQQFKLRRLSLRFEDQQVEDAAAAFTAEEDKSLVFAAGVSVLSVYSVCFFITMAETVGRAAIAGILSSFFTHSQAAAFVGPVGEDGDPAWETVRPLCLFAAAVAVELYRLVDIVTDGSGAASYSMLALSFGCFCGGLITLAPDAMAGVTVQSFLTGFVGPQHLTPQLQAHWALAAAFRYALVACLSVVEYVRYGPATVRMTSWIIFALPVVFLYYARRGSRLRFQIRKHTDELVAFASSHAETQESLTRALLPRHCRAALATEWYGSSDCCGSSPKGPRSWSINDAAVIHLRLHTLPAPSPGDGCESPRSVPALTALRSAAHRWGQLLDLTREVSSEYRPAAKSGVGPQSPEGALLEYVEGLGDDVVIAGPFCAKRTLDDSIDAARAAVEFLRRASRALAAPVPGLDGGASFVAGVGAGATHAALLGAARLTYRLLGQSRREASALLNAVPDLGCGPKRSVAFASPAFRRLLRGFGEHCPTFPGILPSASSSAVHHFSFTAGPTSSSVEPPLSDASEDAVFGDPQRWRVRGLGVVTVAHIKDMF